jgi:hypothetical protein
MFCFFKTLIRIIKNIKLLNWIAVVFSLTTIVFLLIAKSQINERFKKQLRKVPLPFELIVVSVIRLFLDFFANLNSFLKKCLDNIRNNNYIFG